MTDEIGIFTLIEFLHDHVAKPDERSGWYHNFSGCGWHFDRRDGRFDVSVARREWRDKVNGFLQFYGDGYELSPEGEIARLAPDGLSELLTAGIPVAAGDVNAGKLKNAVRTFRRGLSTREERKQAVRDLVDLLEFYRPQLKIHGLSKDEADLFNIANNFSIRHHRPNQKNDYDDSWLSWMFYVYLSSVHLILERVHGRAEPEPADQQDAVASAEPSEQWDDDIPF